MKRTFVLCLNLLALTTVNAFTQTPPAGYVTMPQGVTCLGYDTTHAGQEGTGWTLQSIGSLRCGRSGASVTSYREVALASHNVTDGKIETSHFGTFVVLAQPALSGSSALSGAGVQFGPGGTVTPLSTDERPSTYATNQGGTRLQLAIGQGAVNAFSDFLQTVSLATPTVTPPTDAAIPRAPCEAKATASGQRGIATDSQSKVVPVNDPRDQKLLAQVEGAKMGDTTLPSGAYVPSPPAGMIWRVRGCSLVLEENAPTTSPSAKLGDVFEVKDRKVRQWLLTHAQNATMKGANLWGTVVPRAPDGMVWQVQKDHFVLVEQTFVGRNLRGAPTATSTNAPCDTSAKLGDVIEVNDRSDEQFLRMNEGSNLSRMTLPSGKYIPCGPEGMLWRVRGGKITLEENK